MIIPKKELGQNFLKNKKIIKKIIYLIKPKKKQNFLEIGCGQGELTNHIIKYINNITVIEIDKDLLKKLKKNKKIFIINKNILKINFLNLISKKNKKIRIFGNIPYNISNKLIYKFIKYQKYIKDIHITLQKEFAELLLAKKGEKKYSKLTVLTKSLFKIKYLIKIEKNNFYPIPKIDSIFIKLKPNKNKYKIKNFNNFSHIINISFSKKNKKIKNNLKNIINISDYKNINLNLNLRPNKLTINDYCKINNLLINKIK